MRVRPAGLARRGPGLGVVCADFNGDGWPDVLAANGAEPNFLWVNRGGQTFADEAVERGVALNALGNARSNMGAPAPAGTGGIGGEVGARPKFVRKRVELPETRRVDFVHRMSRR